MTGDVWCVAVFKCEPKNVAKTLVEFYDFVKDLLGVKSHHFLIRDRVNDEVVFSYRLQVDSEQKVVVSSKLAYKLREMMLEDKFAVDPSKESPFSKFVGWDYEDRIARCGVKKFSEFCRYLSLLSKLVVQMSRRGYFDSSERVELAHVVSWMLGCTEYGLMSPQHWEIGYYDRIENKNRPYLKQYFPKASAE